MEKIFRMSETKLLKYLSRLLKTKQYENIIKTKDYIYAEGNIPVMLVAHLDTVHYSLPKRIFHDQIQNVLWSPEGLGADDRAGVWAILQLITDEKKPYIIFTTKEEIGGVGAYKVIDEIKNIPPVNLIIELDRKGSNDAVFYSCDNKDFVDYVENFGFTKNYGSFSDISIICPEWRIAGVNLSTGYYNAHTKEEYLNVNELNDVILKVKKIFDNLPANPFEYIEEIKTYHNYDYLNNFFYCLECKTWIGYYDESSIRDICNNCFDMAFPDEKQTKELTTYPKPVILKKKNPRWL
jgi:hypothetical protein